MSSRPPTRLHVTAVLLALTAALFARALLQIKLREAGTDPQFAADLSYLVVPPILALLLFPVLTANKEAIREQFKLSRLKPRLILGAIAIGVLLRVGWWSHLVAFVSLGIYRNGDPNAVIGPALSFQCPPVYVLVTGLIVMAVLVPTIEELINRGIVQSALYQYGPGLAVGGSAVVFTVFHPFDSWAFVFLAGLVFGTQFWITRSLWSSLLTHATFNGLIQLDWRCLHGQWNPPTSDIPLVLPASIALALLFTCVASIAFLLLRMHRGE